MEVLECRSMRGIVAYIMEDHLCWVGHVIRMGDARLPKALLYGELTDGLRNIGAPKKWYKDQLKATLKCCQMSDTRFEALAHDGAKWRAECKERVNQCEHLLVEELKYHRSRRKERAIDAQCCAARPSEPPTGS